ncbi:MAG: ABC transporter permease [Acidimicrobiia bacterium]|nr:ABC transporter permease [Acidimicrobiia bacterium]
MLRAAFKSVFAHKLRLFMTALAIIIGVGFVAGTFVFTDSINRTFDNLFEDAFEGIDVVVTSQTDVQVGFSGPPPFDEEILDTVRRVTGVAAAEGAVTGIATIVDKQGEPIRSLGPPTLGLSFGVEPELQGNVELRAGRAPVGPGEVTVDAATAEANDLAVGDIVQVLLPIPTEEFEIVGIIGFGESDNLAGATIAAFELAEAQRVLDVPGQYHQISIKAADGVAAELLRDNVARAIGTEFNVVTAADEAAEQSEALGEALGFIGTVLLVFAAISVFVGAFIIYNTFSIIVAQRVREMGLMRAIGASRGQVLSMVMIEGAVVAVVASAIGLGFGLLISNALYALLGAGGFSIPSSPPQLGMDAVIAGLAVGIVITLVSAIIPALRASQIPPIAALQEVTITSRRPMWHRTLTGAVIGFLGLMLILLGLFTDIEIGPANSLVLVGIGALVVFIGVSVASVAFIKPLTRFLSWPIRRWSKVTGRLAQDNAIRRPRRAASTASALMIGLALVGFFYVLGESIKQTTSAAIESGFKADYVVTAGGGFLPSIEPGFADRLAEDPQVDAVTSFRLDFWDNDGIEDLFIGMDIETIEATVDLGVIEGDIASLADGGVFVFDQIMDDNGWTLGDTVTMGFVKSGYRDVEIVGVFTETGIVNSSYLVSMETFAENSVVNLESVIAIKLADGVTPDTGRALIEAEAVNLPGLDIRDGIEYREAQEQQVDSILALFQGLLFLAVVIALLGIVNTLVLSIFERTREIGLLRAVGMSRWQVRRMVLWESIVVAVIGGVFGIVIGTFFGIVVVTALGDVGIDTLGVPVGQLLSLLIVAAFAGVLASIGPARRAAKLNVLEAISYE